MVGKRNHLEGDDGEHAPKRHTKACQHFPQCCCATADTRIRLTTVETDNLWLRSGDLKSKFGFFNHWIGPWPPCFTLTGGQLIACAQDDDVALTSEIDAQHIRLMFDVLYEPDTCESLDIAQIARVAKAGKAYDGLRGVGYTLASHLRACSDYGKIVISDPMTILNIAIDLEDQDIHLDALRSLAVRWDRVKRTIHDASLYDQYWAELDELGDIGANMQRDICQIKVGTTLIARAASSVLYQNIVTHLISKDIASHEAWTGLTQLMNLSRAALTRPFVKQVDAVRQGLNSGMEAHNSLIERCDNEDGDGDGRDCEIWAGDIEVAQETVQSSVIDQEIELMLTSFRQKLAPWLDERFPGVLWP